MKTMLDPRSCWHWNRAIVTRLIKWCLALLQGRRYTVRLETEGTGYHDPLNHIIQANPQLFPKEEPETQFRATQGLLAHECGHAWFTGCWPDQSEGRLQEMTNFLEDARIEAAIDILYPGVVPAIRLLGDLTLAGLEPRPYLPPNEQAYACCLAWRWAHDRIGEEVLFERLKISAPAQSLWGEVRPLVESAWRASNTGQVIAIARDILARLGIDPHTPPMELIMIPSNNIPRQRSDRALPFPLGPSEHLQPGLGKGAEEPPETPFGDRYSEPESYLDLEAQSRPLASRLVGALQLPTPDTRPEPHETSGRYSFRQEVRTPDTPHLLEQGVQDDPRDLALYLLVDRSGSMRSWQDAVRLALMGLHLAATQLEIPTGLAFFGANDEHCPERFLEATPISPQASEAAEALIAGFEGQTYYEFLYWALCHASEALRNRPERRKVLLILHDGDPVFSGVEGDDWSLSLAQVQTLERQGIAVIGVYLGDETDMIAKLKRLFSRLVVTGQGQALPETLGNLLRGLA